MADDVLVTRGWMVMSSVGLALGIPGGLALGAPLEVLVGAMLVTPLMLGLAGLFLGASQWVALRGRLQPSGRWIVLTAVGLAAGFTLAVVAVEQGGAMLTGSPVRMGSTGTLGLLLSVSVIGVLGGGILGLAQSLALRQFEGATAKWVAASALGLTAGFGSGVLVALTVGGLGSVPGLALFLGVTGIIYSATTRHVLEGLPEPA